MPPNFFTGSSGILKQGILAAALICSASLSNAEPSGCTNEKIERSLTEIGHPDHDIRLLQRYRLEGITNFFGYWVNDAQTIGELQKLRGDRIGKETSLLSRVELQMADEFEREVAALAFSRLTVDLRSQSNEKTLGDLTSKLVASIEAYGKSECNDEEALLSLAASFEEYANYRLSPGASEDGLPFASIPRVADILAGLAPGIANVLFLTELSEGTPFYYAVVFLQDRIKKIKLASVEEVTDALALARESITEVGDLADLGRFSELVWHPILAALPEKVGVVRLKPTGTLYYAPFSALLDQQGVYAAKRFDIEVTDRFSQFAGRFSRGYLVDMAGDSVHQYFERDPFYLSKADSLIIAGPDFDAGQLEKGPDHNSVQPKIISRSAEGLYFSPLPGALREGLAIQKSLPDTGVTRFLSGEAATRDAVISMVMRKPKLLHIATHGYSIADVSAPPDARDPFLSSGLALAGSNVDKTESLLSSRQIIEMDLSETFITFLSACNTAVGDSLEGESIASLQQAFRLAGAKNVISTIWPISDAGATRFSEYFFENYSEESASTLLNAQRSMMEDEEFSHPYFWAGYSTFSTTVGDREYHLNRFEALHKKRPDINFTLSLFKGGTMVIRGLRTEEIKSFAELYRDFVPQIYSAELMIFELEDDRSFAAYRGEDAYYPLGVQTFADIERHLNRLKESDFESRDEVLLTIALANHLLPRSDLLDGGKVDRRYLPDINEERATSLLEGAFETSIFRGFESRGYLQTAMATAIGLQGLLSEEDHDALLARLTTKAHKAGVADSSTGFSNRESNATDLRKQWFRYCLRSRIGARQACETPQWAQVRYTADSAGRVFESEVFDPSSQEFGTFLKRELASRVPPVRLLPKNPTAFSASDRVFQSTYAMGWSLKK